MATAATASDSSPTRGWNIALWILQVLLALAFGMAGVMKSTAPIADLAAKMGWPGVVPPGLVRFIGISELAGAIGLILPAATRIMPKLTALAGLGLTVVMVLAACFHFSRGEAKLVPINVVLGGLTALVAWGRWKKAPIAPR